MPVRPTQDKSVNQRRSKRLRRRIPVTVRAQSASKPTASEKTDALVVSAHGGLILLAMEVKPDQFVILTNTKTGEELLCRVTGLGPRFMGKTEIGIEFIKPTPGFWGITERPDDWEP